MENILTVTIPFFALMGGGYIAGRARLFTAEAIDGMIFFVFYFALPCMLFRYMALSPLNEITDFSFMGSYAAVSLFGFVLAALGSRLLFHAPAGVMALQGQGGSIGNVGFLGLPMIAALLGKDAALAVALALLVDLIVFMPLTLSILEIDKHNKQVQTHQPKSQTILKILRGTFLNPFVLSIGCGVLVSAFNVTLPVPVDSFTGLLGAAASPCALFALGASLAGRSLSDDFKEAGFMIGMKLFIHPLVMWLAMTYVFNVKPMWALAAVLVAGLPVAGNVFILAQTYGFYTERSSTAILLSTAIAVVTFSMLVALLT
ncbi:MAG: AEC family transporter [Rhodospirillaceae bacterium]|jgi:malonate transporter